MTFTLLTDFRLVAFLTVYGLSVSCWRGYVSLGVQLGTSGKCSERLVTTRIHATSPQLTCDLWSCLLVRVSGTMQCIAVWTMFLLVFLISGAIGITNTEKTRTSGNADAETAEYTEVSQVNLMF